MSSAGSTGSPPYCPVDAAGRFFHAEGADGRLPEELIGKTVWEANPIVIEILQRAAERCSRSSKVEHSYPHCWRCHKPTIFRATEQWFIGMDRNDLRQRALDAIRKVKWMPAWGEERIHNMIADRPDWCISRQRVWGVPIIVFYCEGCREPFTDRKVLDRCRGAVRASTRPTSGMNDGCGTDAGRNEVRQVRRHGVPQGERHSRRLVRLRVRAISPCWDIDPNCRGRADMYLEGGDQYRGWFHSSLLVGVGLKGSAPYRECATNGWTLDGEGRAMSKSLGNVIEPEKIIKQYGADVLRLWVASVEFNEDVRLSDTILQRLTEAYRKLRNTFRYALGNLDDFDPTTDALPGDRLLEVDQWILLEAEELVRKCRAWYDEYAFHKVYRAIYDFATVESERRLLRHVEGPAVHGSAGIARTAQRADGDVSDQLCAGASAGSASGLHGGRGLVAT